MSRTNYQSERQKFFNALTESLERHEGLRTKPYLCSEGKLTILPRS